MFENLPLYEAVLNDETDGIYAVSLVSSPATETPWQCFNKQEEMFSIQDED